MQRFFEKCSGYRFLSNVIIVMCVVTLCFVFITSWSLMPYNASSTMIKALDHYTFFPIAYVIVIVLAIFIGIISFIRFMQNKKNGMYLIHFIFIIILLGLMAYGFDLVKMTAYMNLGMTSKVNAMIKGLNEAQRLKHLMSMLFAFTISGYLSVGMLLMCIVLKLQIGGKLYFPRRE